MRLPVIFEKLSMFDRWEEPCSIALPFAEGELKDSSRITMLDAEKPIPSQTQITSLWPDGSIKWLMMHFLADLPGGAGKSFECCTETASVDPRQKMTVKLGDGACSIDTSAVTVHLSAPGERGVFRSVASLEGFKTDEVRGPVIQDESGMAFDCVIGPEGWEVLEEGPIRAVVQARGKHAGESGGEWFDYVVRVYAYAGKPWMRVDYQIINREKEAEQLVSSLNMQIDTTGNMTSEKAVETGIGISNYITTMERGGYNKSLAYTITAEKLKLEGNEHFPESFYGTFFGHWSDAEKGGVTLTLYQAQQNFPKSLHVTGHSVTAGIIPEGTNLAMIQGVAKTHRMLLHVHGPKESIEDANIRSLQFQMPDRPILPAAYYDRAGVMEPLHVENKLGNAELGFTVLADYRARAYGILHWGDGPDRGYSEQGRGKGDWVWTNNEYDMPHALMHLYARKGQRRFMDYLLVAAEHWMDVDICHYSDNPLRFQGQIPHSPRHVTDNPVVCHEWVEGLLDYYHLTGERCALEAAVGIGENVLRLLATPRYQGAPGGIQARESGWALRSLGALYVETGDGKWLAYADRIVDQFEEWMNKYGTWLSPYTDHTVIRVPFMIAIAVNSLMRYYKFNPQDRIKRMIVHAVSDALEHTYMEDEGVFMYKDLPSIVKLETGNPLILEALSYAYEFTGEKKFLLAGRVLFNQILARIDRENGGQGKEISGDAVILWQGMGPKMLAQYYYPMFYYYRTASGAGIEL
ncbi:beta-L-arabinofuranosidase domain-containing protein [Paenibacillus sp. HB172176]|uniref:exo-rhamnogalacturonan lyase family protein n=1 Tax=Paenibacillus sp. HB172176 TaxID=2493690 RepID=UPI00143A9437|nr:beta-L-arabinofuranosidase domain-containing protein [Paenibacillus sp. HB172176]